MNTKRLFLLILALSLSVVLAACGDPDANREGAGGGGIDAGAGSSPGCSVPGWDGEGSPPPMTPSGDCDAPVGDGPEEPVSSTPGDPGDEPDPGPSYVEPQPGQENVMPIGWEKARLSEDGRRVRIVFWSGVEPCYVLDSVEVEYHSEKVVITLFQGSTPTDEDVACIDIALQKVTTVELDEPLRGRKLVDGGRS